MDIEKCPLCGGDCHVKSIFTLKDDIVYSECYDDYRKTAGFPCLTDFTKKYYCSCDRACFAYAAPNLIKGAIYPTEQEAITAWNDFVAQWNIKTKCGE